MTAEIEHIEATILAQDLLSAIWCLDGPGNSGGLGLDFHSSDDFSIEDIALYQGKGDAEPRVVLRLVLKSQETYSPKEGKPTIRSRSPRHSPHG